MTKGMTDKELSVHAADGTGREDQWSPRDQYEGGNLSGHDPMVEVFMVPKFQGMSGEGNNQTTDRPKGSS
jgi:hypothetical protein